MRHLDHAWRQPHPVVAAMVEEVTRDPYPYWYRGIPVSSDRLRSLAAELRDHAPDRSAPRAQSLAGLRRAAAKDAINARALHDVLQALHRRGVPVRSEVIDDGVPRRYRWTPASRRFVLARPDSAGLSFTLLGPSRSLVRKHRDRLPVLEASRIALAFSGEIRSITPSNQLSYIGCFRHADQSILISGDAGCVDFAQGRGSYFPQLLDALRPLHVIQVAHHGGNNAHFYRVLAAAGYPAQDDPSFLLLSHATHDITRPSDVFRDFLLTTLGDGDDVRVLFTSEPTRDKVADYLGAIHAPVGAVARTGDIRLRFDGGWNVGAHAIEVR